MRYSVLEIQTVNMLLEEEVPDEEQQDSNDNDHFGHN